MSGQGQSIKTNINYNSTSSTLTIDNKYIILDSTNNGIYIQNSNSITDVFAIIWANTTSYKLINNELFTSFGSITTLLNNEFGILKFSPTSISTNFTMFENIEATKEIRLYELFILTDNTKNTEIETYLLNKYNQNLHTYISFDTMSSVSEYLLFHNILNSFSYMSVGINNDKTLKAINISDNSKSYPNSNLSYFATENNNINILSVPKIAPVNTDKLEICGFQNGIIKPVINITNKTDNTNIECNIQSNLIATGEIKANGKITVLPVDGDSTIQFDSIGNKRISESFGHFWFVNNGNRMIIKSDGNVGIGTTDPSYPLDVSGDINFTGSLRVNGVAQTFGGGGGGGSSSNIDNTTPLTPGVAPPQKGGSGFVKTNTLTLYGSYSNYPVSPQPQVEFWCGNSAGFPGIHFVDNTFSYTYTDGSTPSTSYDWFQCLGMNMRSLGHYDVSDDRLKINEELIQNSTNTLLKLRPQIYDKKKNIR